jgi:cytochrome c5
MKLLFPVLILAVAALPALLNAGGGNAASGEAVFAKSCKMCHGAQGQGNPVIAKTLNATIPDLGSKEVQAKSDEELKKEVVEGKGKMKPVKSASPSEIADAIAHIRTLAKK